MAAEIITAIEAQAGSDLKKAPALVSVVVLAYNEELNLPDCLKSLAGLPCEVFVVDSGSTDSTRDIAREAGAVVVEHRFENYSAQRNWAQQNLALSCDWVMHLDADERLTPELVAEIAARLQNSQPGIDGYMFRKRTVFMGRWIRHGGHYPSYHLRLFRKNRGHCEHRLYDQHFVVDGRTATLNNDYIDVLTADLKQWTARHMRWAELEAQEAMTAHIGNGRVEAKAFGDPIQRRRWLRESFYGRWPLLLRPFVYWFYRYFLRMGFLDGREGLVFHFLQGCWFRLMIDVKLYELRKHHDDIQGIFQ